MTIKRASVSVLAAAALLFYAGMIPAKATSEDANKGFDLYKKGQYAQAQALLMKAALAEPNDVSYLYNLAMAAFGNKDVPTALRALNRVMVMSPTNSQYAVAASKLLTRYQPGCMPFSSDMSSFYRWSKKDMPLRVYVTDGLQLPPSASNFNFNIARIKELGAQVWSPAFYRQLQRVSTYKPEFARYVRAGLDQWAWASKYGLSYTVVNDPTHANIIVVWCNKAQRNMSWLVPSVPVFSILQLECDPPAEGKGNEAEVAITQFAAHEIGHSFGLGHSQCETDLMSPELKMKGDLATMRVTSLSVMSASDRASLKALYDFNH